MCQCPEQESQFDERCGLWYEVRLCTCGPKERYVFVRTPGQKSEKDSERRPTPKEQNGR